MKKIFALLVVAVLFVACGDESSSSAPAPDPSEESSSSLEKTTESSSSAKPTSSEDKPSSSSAKKEESSSSVVKTSSSSATPKSSSSEDVKQSSSSVVASSSSVTSSETVESSSSVVIPVYLNPDISYSDLEDSRDSRIYKYFTVTGKDTNGKKVTIKVMAQNLNVGVMIDGEKNQEDDSKIERYCYDNDSINCLIYGGLYQWAEVMQLPSRCNTESCADLIKPNHQGICPAGWRLLTSNDFYIVVHAEGNKNGVEDVRATAFGGYNYTGYSLVGAGIRDDDAQNSRFADLNEGAYWFYPTEQETRVNRAGVSYSSKSMTGIPNGYGSKLEGLSVRCVMVE